MAAREGLPEDRYLEIRFEDLLTDPRVLLQEVADFFELDGRDRWIDRAAALVRVAPALRAEGLPCGERERLDAACRAGMRLLRRV